MTARRLGRATAIAACMVVFAASGCRLGDLSFREDKRIVIISPENRADVALPFDLTWTVEDFEVVGADGTQRDDAGYFAVLLDVTPMPPGETLDYFARDDETCKPAFGCPDKTYLSDRNIYLTKLTTFSVDTLADSRPVDRQSADDDHEITVILLNGKSERIGESAYRRTVIVDRGQDGA